MPKRKIAVGETHGFIGEKKTTRKPPKQFDNPQWIIDYWLKRDRVIFSNMFTDEKTKQDILKRYNKL